MGDALPPPPPGFRLDREARGRASATNPVREALLAKRMAARGAPLASLGETAVQNAGAAAGPPLPEPQGPAPMIAVADAVAPQGSNLHDVISHPFARMGEAASRGPRMLGQTAGETIAQAAAPAIDALLTHPHSPINPANLGVKSERAPEHAASVAKTLVRALPEVPADLVQAVIGDPKMVALEAGKALAPPPVQPILHGLSGAYFGTEGVKALKEGVSALDPDVWETLSESERLDAMRSILGGLLMVGGPLKGAARGVREAKGLPVVTEPGTRPVFDVEGRGTVPQATVDAINEGVRELIRPPTPSQKLERLDEQPKALQSETARTTPEPQAPRPASFAPVEEPLRPAPQLPASAALLEDVFAATEHPRALENVLRKEASRNEAQRKREALYREEKHRAELQRAAETPGEALRMILDEDVSRRARAAGPPDSAPAVAAFETPEEVDRGFLSGLGLSEEQAQAVGERMPTTDAVTGFATARHHGPTLERAQEWAERTGRPAQYVEIDLHNLGGMNATLGHSGADRVVRQMTDAVRGEFPEQEGKRIAFIRHGGDELSLVATGYTEAEISQGMTRAEESASRVVRAAGLNDIPHAKGARDEYGRDRRRGAGLVWGAAPIEPGVSLELTRAQADSAVEARKFTRRAEDVDRKQDVPSRNPSGPRSGGNAAADLGEAGAGQRGAQEGPRGERTKAAWIGRGTPAEPPRGPLPRGVEDEGRDREVFRKRHGEDVAGLERFLSLADAVRKEAPDATPEEVQEAAFALFAEHRKLDATPARGSTVDARPGAAHPGNARGRRAVAEGTSRTKDAPSGAEPAGTVTRRFSRPSNPNARGISVRDLAEAVSRVERKWPSAPEIAVIRNESELPLEVQAEIGSGKVTGAYHGGQHGTPGRGTVYLLADRVSSLQEAFGTLVHEVVGHAGVSAVLGPRGWKTTIQEVWESRDGRRLVDEWNAARGRGYSFDLTTERGREGAISETVAWMAERKLSDPSYRPPGFYSRLVARVRLGLRGLGREFGFSPKALEWSEADLDSLIARAAREYERKAPGEAEGSRFSRAVGETKIRFSKSPEGDPENQAPEMSDAQRRRITDMVSRTRERLAEVDPRWKAAAEDLAAEPTGELTAEQPARPDLANPGVEPDGRRLVDRVDRAREQQNEPTRRADAEVNAEADRRLEEDWEGERRALLARGRQGAGLDDTETVTAKKIVSAEAFAAMKARDVETLAETAELIDAYRRTGTEQARAFRHRRDEVKSPRERLAAFVAEAVLRPGVATAEKIRTGTPAERKEALRKHAEQAKAALEELRKRGIDVAGLSDENLSDRFLVARVVREVAAQRADLSDKVFEYWANSILSGPLTHIANITGNQVSLAVEYGLQQPLEMALGSVAGGSRSLAEGKALYGSLWRGVVRGARNAVESFQTEQRALGEKGDPLAPDRLEARVGIGGKAGRVVRIPYRFLRAADEFYRGVIGEMEAAAAAHGIARKEGLSGDASARRMAELLEDGESEAWQAATDRADLLTFQKELGRYGQLILDGRRKIPGLRYIIPFVTTPANIFKTALRKTPLGGVRSLYLISRGELSRDEAIRSGAEQLIGMGVLALLAQGLGGGDDDKEPGITGTVPFRGSMKGERDMAERTAPPLSVRVDGKWYGYGRLEPLATWLGMTVDALRGVKEARAGDDVDAVIGKTLKRFVAQLEDKTFLDGLGRIIRAIDDGKSAARIVGDVGAGFVPALLRQPAQAAEGKARESRAWGAGPSEKHEGERYESRLARRIAERAAPFLFDGTPRVNAYGEDVEKPNRTYIGRLLSPVQRFDPETLSPTVRRIDAAFQVWNEKHPEAPYYPPVPDPRYTRGGRTYFLSDEEYRTFLRNSGGLALEPLKALVDRAGGTLTPEDIESARKIFRDAAKAARKSLKGERVSGRDGLEVAP